jgi:signal transduction histidine kinase
MQSRRVPWALHLAALLTWAVVGVGLLVVVWRRPDQLGEPAWLLRLALYLAWIPAYFGATWGELRWNDSRRAAFLLAQAGCAVALLASTRQGSVISLVFPACAEASFLLSSRRAVLLVAAQTLALAAIAAAIMPPLSAAISTFCLMGGEIFGLGAGHLAAGERRAREELARVYAELQATQGLLAESVLDAERGRISRDLHDTLGHHLTALSVNLEVASHLAEGRVAEHVGQAHAVAKLLLADVREVVSALHEERAIDLAGALAAVTAGVPQPKIQLALSPGLRIADAALAHAVFRCVQEMVTNAVRHAEARNLWIEVRQGPGGLTVEARDDGRGAPGYAPGHGLTGMGERLRALGGSLVVASYPGRGFEVRATLPLPQDAP